MSRDTHSKAYREIRLRASTDERRNRCPIKSLDRNFDPLVLRLRTVDGRALARFHATVPAERGLIRIATSDSVCCKYTRRALKLSAVLETRP